VDLVDGRMKDVTDDVRREWPVPVYDMEGSAVVIE